MNILQASAVCVYVCVDKSHVQLESGLVCAAALLHGIKLPGQY